MNITVQVWMYLALAMMLLELMNSGLVFFFFSFGSFTAGLLCFVPFFAQSLWAAPAVYALTAAVSFVCLRERLRYALSGSLFDADGAPLNQKDTLLGSYLPYVKGNHICHGVVGNLAVRSAIKKAAN